MPIYYITPKDQEHERWQASTYRGPIVARAKDEKALFDLLSTTFWIATDSPRLTNPWKPDNVTLDNEAPLIRTTYPEDGPDEVLEPARYSHL